MKIAETRCFSSAETGLFFPLKEIRVRGDRSRFLAEAASIKNEYLAALGAIENEMVRLCQSRGKIAADMNGASVNLQLWISPRSK